MDRRRRRRSLPLLRGSGVLRRPLHGTVHCFPLAVPRNRHRTDSQARFSRRSVHVPRDYGQPTDLAARAILYSGRIFTIA